jgi:Recombination endonuclease VII
MDILSPDSPQRRVCRHCHKEKSVESFRRQGVYTAAICLSCAETLPHPPLGMKRCSRCLEINDLSAFNMIRGKPYSYCRLCHQQYRNSRHDSEKRRDENLRRNYGITSEDYGAMWLQQGGVCAVCKSPEMATDPYTKKLKNLAVDHCHTTGQVRGLLCETCNQLLGLLEKDPQRVTLLLGYLEKHLS